ncbi:BRD8 [Lepeophtheirus salmonis]|uniref:BRD8 n=1 Tax=Lepeophtheirus salmonis TaxID=72036 RepID=A0A7R8HEU3_LEPSM|nr:BRD8 [Lepeophtheirus salmonis]CAF3034736.1 BRD8 [Lepeophtheirus salmonis]
MDEEVTFDEESSPMIEDSVLSKKESALTSTAKPTMNPWNRRKIIKSKRSTRATIKKENEPSASKSSGEDADIEDSIKITRRKNKHASEKQQNPDEESVTPNPSLSSSSNSKRKSVIKVEDETLDEVISGPILTRGSRRGSSRSSSPTGSVIMNEEISELSEPRTRTSTRRKSGKVTPAESEHESVPPSPAPSEEEHTWKKSAFSAIEDIKSCNHQILEAPGDPLGIVKKPFDLGTINKNLENGIYKTLPEFQRDIQLLLLNMVIVVPYSSEVYDQFNKIQQDINQIMSSLINNTLSLTKPVVSSKRKRTSSVLSATDANSSCSNGSSSKSKRRKTRGDD